MLLDFLKVSDLARSCTSDCTVVADAATTAAAIDVAAIVVVVAAAAAIDVAVVAIAVVVGILRLTFSECNSWGIGTLYKKEKSNFTFVISSTDKVKNS